MKGLELESANLRLTLQSVEEALARVDALPPEVLEQVSAEWLARIRGATSPDPWIHGFVVTRAGDGVVVGECGFKGPPEDGAVEIAYAVEPEHRGKGYATEAAAALSAYAATHPAVQVVRAHTLCEPNASTQVLKKCRFQRVGEVIDPDDGPVWRWELDAAAAAPES